jgi:hypothetical protein
MIVPCQIFLSMKDPKTSEEEHKMSIGTRVARLRGQKADNLN